MGKENYLSMKDLYNLLPIGKNQSDKLFKTIEQSLVDEGYTLFITRPRVLPKDYVMKFLRERKYL